MITCKHGERNDDESCWNCENERKESAADLRQLHRDAALAALAAHVRFGRPLRVDSGNNSIHTKKPLP